MNRLMKKLAPMVSLTALGLASVAGAGVTTDTAYCYQFTDGSGYCSGNFLGWRNNTQSTAYTYFYENDAGSRSFYARYTLPGNTSPSTFSCIPGASVSAMWGDALANRGRFFISWTATGTCDYLALYNGSQYTNF